jgi:magnesium-transporting ATPase (P-type)
MLWVNLIMDSLGSLALATEPPYEELLQREPTRRNESMINGRMWKHIILQSLIQIILLIIFYLLAPEFIKEDNLTRVAENKIIKFCYNEYPGKDTDYIIYGTEVKWPTDGKLRNHYKLYCGEYAHRSTLTEAYKEYINANSATTHLTLIFNIFVFYTLFNQINCRVIDDSLNIFVRITRSLLFIIICLVEMGLQVLIIFVGKSPIHVVNEGLTGNQWGICIGFSAITFVVSIVVKFIPIHICIDAYLDRKIKQEEEEEEKIDENEKSSQNMGKSDIGKRTMTRRLSKRSNKQIVVDSKGMSGNQGVNIYSLKKSQ